MKITDFALKHPSDGFHSEAAQLQRHALLQLQHALTATILDTVWFDWNSYCLGGVLSYLDSEWTPRTEIWGRA